MTTRREMLASMALLGAWPVLMPRRAAGQTTAPLVLTAMMGTYPDTRALKSGAVTSPLVALQFADVAVPNTAFKRTVRDLEFDVSELAIATFLIAKAAGKPLVLMPAVMFSRFQAQYVVYNAARGLMRPTDLAGKRIGARSYTTTTGMWARGVLENDFGVNFDGVRWVTYEDPHVAEYSDPPSVERAPAGSDLLGLLLAGQIDAAIMTPLPDDPRIRTILPDPAAAASAWHAKHRAVQVNHMVVVRESLTRSRPDVVREVYRLLRQSKASAPLPDGTSAAETPYGIEANRRSLELAVEYALQQKLITRRFSVDELFNDVTGSL